MRFDRSSLAPLALSLLFALTLQSGSARAQDTLSAEDEALMQRMMQSITDPAAAEETRTKAAHSRRWTEGSGIVQYHIVGEYQARTNVVGGGGGIGYGDVTDRVVIDLDWKLADARLVGTPVILNTKSVVRNLRDFEPTCLPPILKGEYEHYELLGLKPGLSGQLEATVQTSYPVVQVVQFCTGAYKSIPAKIDRRPQEFGVLSPVMLDMPLPDSDDLRVSPDRKSLITRKAGWTWTFTPSVKK